ncbi:bifunctional adenosylcobinamide kinase/adenosylcobinamide-phosphate guanylyltransferase [Spongisporangium articulatum]|uniref:Adenosylcobinamide kinase n=1 Tax=Spongisporangium articulatum TaxID=3362603 RepID=A0ABW8ASZ2_9ACTN
MTYDAVVLGEEVLAAAHTLARRRAAGELGPDARVGFAGPTTMRPRRLALLLAAWGGSRADALTDPGTLPAVPRLGGRTLVLGGASSGKSAFAEALLAAEPQVTYLATGPRPAAEDADWAARVARHRERRPAWWSTVESPDAALELTTPTPVLLDSVGTWLTAALDDCAAWQRPPGWRERLDERVEAFVEAWRARTGTVVAVSDEVGLGVVPATPAGRLFRERLGALNERLAEASDRVLLVVAGQVTEL